MDKEENINREAKYGEKSFEVGDIVPYTFDSRGKKMPGPWKIVSIEQDQSEGNENLLKAVLERVEEKE